MMNLTLHGTGDHNAVARYGADGIVIGERLFSAGVVVMPAGDARAWEHSQPASLGEEDARALLRWEPELVILGTGAAQVFPPPAFLRTFLADGVGCEVMDTGAACRTYNVLASEGRQVLGALFPPGTRQP